MNSTLISAIITAIASIFGVILGSYITLRKFKYERKDKYIFAALYKKLKAHQEAYNLSWDLPSVAHRSNGDDSHLKECEKWFRKNSLYLEPDAREPFYKVYGTAWIYKTYLDIWKETGNDTELKKAWEDITSAISIIEQNIVKPLIELDILRKEEYDYKGKKGDS